MAELATLARPYANAAFDLATEGRDQNRWSRTLAFLARVLAEPAVRDLVASPAADARKAHEILELVQSEFGEVTEPVRRFIQVLASNKRLALLGEVSEQFEALKAEAEKTLDIEVTSAVAMTGEEIERLSAALKARFARDIEVSTAVDGSLIGGAVIRAGDTVVDGSVRGKLDKLAESLART
ncbi:MAG: F0F1 ATP synthase subunit delta [Gammaproteobacteria bacterium]|nr:F0F1 ATP synthase subunit delta [Gammaproteobacteria bacterium]